MTFGPFFTCLIEHYWSTVIYNHAHCVCLVFCVWLCGLVVLLVLGGGCVSGWVSTCVGCLCFWVSPWLCGVVVLCIPGCVCLAACVWLCVRFWLFGYVCLAVCVCLAVSGCVFSKSAGISQIPYPTFNGWFTFVKYPKLYNHVLLW